jgi:hypothetical protein
MEFRLISSHEPDIFQERLNRLIASFGPEIAIGEVRFDTSALPNGNVMFSALVSFKRVENWGE